MSRNEMTRDSAGHPDAVAPRGTAQARYRYRPEPIAPTMLLQIASQDIGQLTDIHATAPRHSPGTTPTTRAPRRRHDVGSAPPA